MYRYNIYYKQIQRNIDKYNIYYKQIHKNIDKYNIYTIPRLITHLVVNVSDIKTSGYFDKDVFFWPF